MFLEEGERLFFGLFIFFAKMLELIALFLMRNYQRYGLIMIYSSQGLTAHTEETDTHQYYLRWPVALSERQVAVPVCSRRKGGAPEHSRSVKRQEDSYKIFHINSNYRRMRRHVFTQPSERYLTIVIRGRMRFRNASKNS